MACLNFGKVNKKFLIPIIGGIVRLIYSFLIQLNSKFQIALKNPFILSIYTNIGMIFAFIPYLILKYRSKMPNPNSNELQHKSKLNLELIVHSDSIEEIKSNKYKLIALSSIFDFSQTIIGFLFCMRVVYNLWIFDIIFISLFSHLILKTKIYRHQYFSMIIILCLGLALNVIEYFKLKEPEKSLSPFEISMKFLTEISLSLNIVIIKYNMEKNYCSPYEICIWEGIVGVILQIIGLVIVNILRLTIDGIQYPDNFFEYFENYNIDDFILCILVIIVDFIYNASIMVTCDYFTPFHILITSIIKEFYYNIKINENIILNIIGIFALILISFMFLVFVEIIELNACNISYNTKKNIERRSQIESSYNKRHFRDSNEEIRVDEDNLVNSTVSSISDNY